MEYLIGYMVGSIVTIVVFVLVYKWAIENVPWR